MANSSMGETESGPFLRLCQVQRPAKGSCGFHLSRTQFDPYPWVSGVEPGSAASQAGLRTGDCVLEVNGEDVLGQRIGQVAAKVKDRDDPVVSLLLWNAGVNDGPTPALHNPVPTPLSLQRLNGCLQAVLQLLECPVCLEPVTPPASQCCNGHVLCCGCRSRAERCPVCRVALGPRGRCLLADKLHSLLASALAPPTPQIVTNTIQETQILNQKPRRVKSRQPISSSQNNIAQEEHTTEDQRIDRPRSLSADQIPNGRKVKRTLGSTTNNIILTPSPTEQDDQGEFLCPHEPSCNSRHTDLADLMHHLRSGDHLGPLVQYAVPRNPSTPVSLPLPEETHNSESGLVMLVTGKGCSLFLQREDHRLWIWSSGEVGFKVVVNRGAPIPAVHPLTKSRAEVIASGRWIDLSTPLPKKISMQLFEDSPGEPPETTNSPNSTTIQVHRLQPQMVN